MCKAPRTGEGRNGGTSKVISCLPYDKPLSFLNNDIYRICSCYVKLREKIQDPSPSMNPGPTWDSERFILPHWDSGTCHSLSSRKINLYIAMNQKLAKMHAFPYTQQN